KKKKEKDKEKQQQNQTFITIDTFRIPIPQVYKDVKLNILFTDAHQSIVTEVQFLLKAMSDFKQKGHPFYEISRQESFVHDSLNILTDLSFDVQLQLASFHPVDIANLMLYFPSQFRTSKFIRFSKDSAGGCFILQMAKNPQVQVSYAKWLCHSDRFIPRDVVQAQLVQPNNYLVYPLMYALQQNTVDCVSLFVPSDTEQSKI
ncbi:hypothetical protein RFI_10917, partial [Reticulomyxa filosa]